MTLKQQLVDSVPRDRSGSLASDRFEYQRNWALCQLLLLHLGDADYVMTFDHHEDVSILNSEENPSEFSGFQVKTKANGNWTDNALIKQGDGANGPLPSIVGKLCSSLSKFPGSVKLLQVVSNAPFRVQLAKDGKCDLTAKLIRFDDIVPEKRKKLLESVKAELDSTMEPSLSGILEFKVSELSLDDHAAHTRGRLVDALEGLFPGQAFSITPVYRALLSEITARNNNCENVESYDEFLRKKSLSRSRFSEILQECGVSKSVAQWSSAEARLNAEQTPMPLILSFKREWPNVMLDRMEKRGDVVHVGMLTAVKRALLNAKEEPTLLGAITLALQALCRRPEWNYSEEYLRTCVLVYLYES